MTSVRRGRDSGLAHPFLRTLDSGLPVRRAWTENGPGVELSAPDRSPGGLAHPFLRSLDSLGMSWGRSWTGNGDGTADPATTDVGPVDFGPVDPGSPAVLELVHDTGRPVLTAVGDPERLAALLTRVRDDLDAPPRGVTLTRGTGALASGVLTGWGLAWGSDWDRMMTTVAPELPGGSLAERIDLERDIGAVVDLLEAANPHSNHRPDQPGRDWYGTWSDDGTLSAVGALIPRDGADGPFAHLGGIATRPDQRGRGLGTAVTARLTRAGIAAYGLVTLGLYADNAPARRVYERLGFRVIHEVETWRPPA